MHDLSVMTGLGILVSLIIFFFFSHFDMDFDRAGDTNIPRFHGHEERKLKE